MSDPTILPVFRYRDASAALDWLKKAFGLEENAVHRDDEGTIRHAQLQLGTGMVMLAQHGGDGWMGGGPPDALRSTVSVYLVVPDPDAHFARAEAEGATIVRELTDEDYGSREYSARDLEGNLWSFGTYDPYAAH